jgi:hypothetical protein
MPRPICFMIMPYGVKPSQKPGTAADAPDQIDFERLWSAAFEPAIREMGYDPVRADQDLGAAIIKEMIERLTISDLVIADVTTPNGNVYYEIGVRHAAIETHCVMIAAEWTTPLFDLNQMRQVRYPLPGQSVDGPTAARIRETLVDKVPDLAAGRSPVYEFVPGYPKPDPLRASSFRKALQELSAFQAEVLAARSLPGGACAAKALELRDRFYSGGPVQGVVALELLYLLRDCTDWTTTLQFIDKLPKDWQERPLIKEQRALALSKSGDHHEAIGALQLLIAVAGNTSERRGLLGGRYKKLFAETTDATQKRTHLNAAIAQYEAGMRLDLNDYYPSSNLARLYRTRGAAGDADKARVSAAVTMVACERARANGGADKWLKPTLLGAAFDAGDAVSARTIADDVALDGPAAWQLETTLADLRRAIELHPADTAAALRPVLADLEALLPKKP